MEREKDILRAYQSYIDYHGIDRIHRERVDALSRPAWDRARELFVDLARIESAFENVEVELDQEKVTVRPVHKLTSQQEAIIQQMILQLIPWRKGPFSLCGFEIDSEWRSNLKWDRAEPALGSLNGKRILDVGCANGYYMFRASSQQPELVVGFDPSERNYLQFEFIQSLVRQKNLSFKMLGVEHCELFPDFFDVVICMGVIYHQRNPLAAIEQLRSALRPGGLLLLETQAIPGEESIAFFPPERYAKLRNVFFVPTVACLTSWLTRLGFVDVSVISLVPANTEEQRRTNFAPDESLAEFLDPSEPTLTREGHPAPLRAIVVGRKR